jgi:hypothetical protein
MDIIDTITKTRLDSNNNKILGTFVPYKTDLMEKAILSKETCHIKGYLTISKAPGDIHISFHPFQNVWEYLSRSDCKVNGRFSLSHQFFSLTFGDSNLNQQILDIFGENEHTQKFSNHQDYKTTFPKFDYEVDSSNKITMFNYDYYIKLIPHLFIDEVSGKEYSAYQYSLSYKSRPTEEEEMPIIMINYDYSPITMKITLKKKSFSNFLIHICAIVGGVYVIFSIFNRIVIILVDGMSYTEYNIINEDRKVETVMDTSASINDSGKRTARFQY